MNLIQYSESDDEAIIVEEKPKSNIGPKTESGIYNKWLQEDSDEESESSSNSEKISNRSMPCDTQSTLISAEFLFSTDTSDESSFLNIKAKTKFEVPTFSNEPVPKNKTEYNDKLRDKLIIEADKNLLRNSSKPLETKDEVCIHFSNGRCKLGDMCKYSHTKPISSDKNSILGKSKEKETVKDKVKRQRLAGQTGIQGGWKSEEEMRQRQMFD